MDKKKLIYFSCFMFLAIICACKKSKVEPQIAQIKQPTVDTAKLVEGLWVTVTGPYFSVKLDSGKFFEDWSNINSSSGAGTYKVKKDTLVFTQGSISDNCIIIKLSADSLVYRSLLSKYVYREFRFVAPVSNYGIVTLAGDGVESKETITGDGELALNALLYPTSATQDSNGNIYIADHDAFEIRILNAADKRLYNFISANPGSPNTVAGMGFPAAVYVYPGDDNLYFADEYKIYKYSITQKTTQLLAAMPAGKGTVTNIIADKNGNVYVTGTDNPHIYKIDAATNNMTAIAGNGVDFPFIPSPGTAANVHFSPAQTALDNNNNLFICDVINNCVWKMNLGTGAIALFAGTGTMGFSGDGGPAIMAQLNDPCGIAIDASNNVYISDYGNTRLRKVDINGNISTIAGRQYGYFADTADADASNVTPGNIYVNAAAQILVCDMRNLRVREVTMH